MRNPKFKFSKQKTNFLICVLGISLGFCAFIPGFYTQAYALDLGRVKVNFLNGDYKSAISEGEKILAGTSSKTAHLDELYYILGLSYLKDGNYLRASDIFEIIIKEFKDSAFSEEAQLSLGDAYFLQGNYSRAENYYKEILSSNPHTKLQPLIYYRLSQSGFKKGDTQVAKEYLDKLREGSPLNLEANTDQDLCSVQDIYYTVQVGSFSNPKNARNLTQKLIEKGYPAYMEEAGAQDKRSYRVRVGKAKLRQEATAFEQKLSEEGYPTKICP